MQGLNIATNTFQNVSYSGLNTDVVSSTEEDSTSLTTSYIIYKIGKLYICTPGEDID